ncbi:MAG: 3-isopropylmalate dehydratase [Polyangiaceae bacterium]|nr:3-isopropylmalate dehydratase [Polyangiaceae bacterium]
MPQKILAGRCSDPQLRGDLVQVKVDQVVLSRAPARALAEANALGLKKTTVEVAVAYDGTCVTDRASLRDTEERGPGSTPPELPGYNIQIARPGIGFPGPVHLERFAAPARLCLTDDPRLATVGGVGMLSLVVSPAMLGQALATGSVWLRPPRSVQVHLSGRVRPFICARDVALELLRKGLDDIVRRIEKEHAAPVVLEFAGPSVRLLSVQERSVLAGIAPQVGAAAAIFVSDEKTEGFLRDQRRSKAHRAIVPDPGAPCEEVVGIDLATVDPLLMDENGQVRRVGDLAGKSVGQVVLGGDSGATLRDMLAAAALLKSKRVPSRLDLLVSPPSRQVLEVLAQQGALVDLVATGARVIEPDARVVSSEVYPPPEGTLSLRTSDPEPLIDGSPRFVVASAETLAYAVASGSVGDPRSFKRPVRVTVPRVLPTDDVLVLRDKKGEAAGPKKAPTTLPLAPHKDALNLDVLEGLGSLSQPGGARKTNPEGVAVLLTSEEARALYERPLARDGVRVVIAPYIPSQAASALAAEGIACFSTDDAGLKSLRGEKKLSLPPPNKWGEGLAAQTAKGKAPLTSLTRGVESTWLGVGGLRGVPAKK